MNPLPPLYIDFCQGESELRDLWVPAVRKVTTLYQGADQNGVVVVNLELLQLLTYIQDAKGEDRHQNESSGIT